MREYIIRDQSHDSYTRVAHAFCNPRGRATRLTAAAGLGEEVPFKVDRGSPSRRTSRVVGRDRLWTRYATWRKNAAEPASV